MFSFKGSPTNVRQRAPIAKPFSSQSGEFVGESLSNSNFDDSTIRQSSRGLKLSPERSLLSSPNDSKQSDTIGTFHYDGSSNAFRGQKGWHNKKIT